MIAAGSSPGAAPAGAATAPATGAGWPSIPALARDAGERFADSEAVVDGVMVSARAWPDHPAWMRAFIALLKQKAPVQQQMAAR